MFDAKGKQNKYFGQENIFSNLKLPKTECNRETGFSGKATYIRAIDR